jgi:transcriptional regulator with XRE-family HTH domain
MDRPGELGEFLRTRRVLLRPQDVGLPCAADGRRVPWLRPGELAQLAGISTGYYTRLEEGHSHHASEGVVEAIARVLRLSEADTTHLRRLARPGPAPAAKDGEGAGHAERAAPERPRAARGGSRLLVGAMGCMPAVLVDRRSTVLAWNSLGHALLAGHLDANGPDQPGRRPNLARVLFLDARARELYPRWETEAKRSVAALRLASRAHPDDPELTELIGELAMKCQRFAALWARRPLRDHTSGTVRVRHPLAGEMTFGYQTLQVLDGSGDRLITYQVEPGSRSESGLRLLAERA